MRPKHNLAPHEGAVITEVTHTVAFYETDAMGFVHHSNHVRFLEHARVRFLAEHDQPYAEYVKQGYHVPVTRVEVHYQRPCRFADEVTIRCWLAWARHASLGFAYQLSVAGEPVGSAATDHAFIRLDGRPCRLPPAMRARISSWPLPSRNDESCLTAGNIANPPTKQGK